MTLPVECSFGFRTAVCAFLLTAAIPLRAAGVPADVETAHQLLAKYSERMRWQHYWLPDTVGRSYTPGAEIDVEVLFASSAAGFCAPAVEVCQIYDYDASGEFRFVTEWKPDSKGGTMPLRDRFAAEYVAARSSPVREVRGDGNSGQPRSFDATRLVAPVRVRPDAVSFGDAVSLKWKLLPLDLPATIRQRVRPADSNQLAAEVAATARNYRRSSCGPGRAVIPFYGIDDPRVYVEVDLGGGCEKGIFLFSRVPEGDWSFEMFEVSENDVAHFVSRIRRVKMETVRINK